MLRAAIFATLILLSACGESNDKPAAAPVKPPSLPLDNGTRFIFYSSLRVPRSGELTWNGQVVSETILKEYLAKYASFPRSQDEPPAGLYVKFEPGLPRERADWVRQAIVDSGLCEKKRCAEIGWNVRTAFVN